jgi:hypothetical protein
MSGDSIQRLLNIRNLLFVDYDEIFQALVTQIIYSGKRLRRIKSGPRFPADRSVLLGGRGVVNGDILVIFSNSLDPTAR